jgi:hypothetical protein
MGEIDFLVGRNGTRYFRDKTEFMKESEAAIKYSEVSG